MSPHRPLTARFWLFLAAPAAVFLLVIIAASVIATGAAGPGPADSAAIAAQVQAWLPQQLIAVQVIVLALLVLAMRRMNWSARDLGWRGTPGRPRWHDVVLGAAVGAALAVAYLWVLSPLLIQAQLRWGDYVPAGELLPTLSAKPVPFFVANVLLAPAIEESFYRGFALTRLRGRFSQSVAVVLSCIFFGLLHWAGGAWYMLLTGVVAGGVLAGLAVWRGSLVAPFAAHLALNFLEFALTMR
jgi:membrane protease YdiL (CAAX protease family)